MERFDSLTTPHLADACLRLGMPLRLVPPGIRPVVAGHRLAGRALPVRHVGSVDIYLEALEFARPGDVLVVDNGGRSDEACVGDLVAIEMREAGLSGIAIWGLHRDTAEIEAIGLPVFSYGATPPGPRRADPRPDGALVSASFGGITVTAADAVFADADGLIAVALDRLDEVFETAESIRDTEVAQSERIASGSSLRDQVRFADFLAAREREASLTFRQHLRGVGGEIEV